MQEFDKLEIFVSFQRYKNIAWEPNINIDKVMFENIGKKMLKFFDISIDINKGFL